MRHRDERRAARCLAIRRDRGEMKAHRYDLWGSSFHARPTISGRPSSLDCGPLRGGICPCMEEWGGMRAIAPTRQLACQARSRWVPVTKKLLLLRHRALGPDPLDHPVNRRSVITADCCERPCWPSDHAAGRLEVDQRDASRQGSSRGTGSATRDWDRAPVSGAVGARSAHAPPAERFTA